VSACLSGGEEESVAVLVRSRTALPQLLAGLRRENIDYQAVEIDRLTDLPEVIDILALTRAMCHLGDRIAWLALLRGPWVGLTWQELHRIVENDTRSTVWDLICNDSTKNVGEFVQTMRTQLDANTTRSLRERVECAWYALGGPAILKNDGELENVYRFLNVVEKFETAGNLADVAKLESLLDDERVSSSASSDCRLQVMTMHRAKGLQFDHVLLYGLGRRAGRSERSVLSWLNIPGDKDSNDLIISPVGPRSELEQDRLHRFIEVSENDKNRLELGRLLYVASTRAKQSLHLMGHVSLASDGQSYRPPQAGSLLHGIWPSVDAVYESAFRAGDQVDTPGDDSNLVNPSFRQFSRPWKLPDAPAIPVVEDRGKTDDDGERQVEYDWVGSSARHAGTIVHRWLQQVADGQMEIKDDELPKLRPVNKRWSERLGVPPDEIDEVCDRVEQALHGILTDPKGRWSLFGDGHAELPLSGIWNGNIESIVIDRVRIDDDGVHWIIDYKTSTHEGGDLEGFLDQESERHRPQLEKYASLYSALADKPVRVALYFPLLQQFREVTIA